MTDLAEFAENEDMIADLKQTNLRLRKQLARAKGKTDELVAATLDAAVDAVRSHGSLGVTPPPPKDRRRSGKPEVALLHATDFQGSKLTPTYNSQVMRERAMRFVEKSIALTEIQRKDHPVRKVGLMFGGDMVEGLFNFPTQAHEIDATIFEQWTTVSGLLVDMTKRLLQSFDEVEVWAEWGNHGRIGSKRDCVPRSDNIDRMCYEFARRLLEGEKRLTWHDSADDIQRVEIGNYRALLIHGDEVGRNGFASLSTIAGHVNKWQAGGYRVDGEPWPFRDLYIGHYHTHYESALPNGQGAIYGTGSIESDNRYAAVHLASQASPSQRLHFIEPARGRVSATYKVHLA